ncbi:putative Flp pilus-assembly TadE/G-like protein [Mumia flava]|uniref:Putative Flp pilus-assembly TadE/G-like protein n=1 Tax=Mumia flava TaxID=1348852 RepID=A0A0B2BRC3_9ACTN|nr:pilus assembly protein TadG-related protein [Mumia flava]PJJ58590.1 putative Flp pilus-assembly TadE/G-like protein [Mumia flava]
MKEDAATGAGDQTGQISVTIIGFALVVGLMVAAVVDATALYLEHRRLADLADGAALAASEGVQRDRLYGQLGGTAPLDANAARRDVARYFAEASVSDVRWRIAQAGAGVRVELVRTVALPIVPPGWDSAVTVRSDAGVVLRTE